MYILIIGSGRFGSVLAENLGNEGHNVVIVDRNEDNFKRISLSFNGKMVKGIEYDIDILLEAGINNADIFLAMTPDDNVNIMASQIAKKMFNIDKIISRISNDNISHVYKALGIETINPIHIGIEVIKGRIYEKSEKDIYKVDSDISIVEIKVKNKIILTVEEIEMQYECRVSAILTNYGICIPKQNDVVKNGDRIICTIKDENKMKLLESLAKEIIL